MSKEVTVIRGKMRQSFSEEEKRRIVAESQHSELSLNKFAKSVGIAAPTLSVWRRQLKHSCAEDHPQPTHKPTASTSLSTVTIEATISNRMQDLESENRQLKNDLSTFKMAFGKKLVELEMLRLGNA